MKPTSARQGSPQSVRGRAWLPAAAVLYLGLKSRFGWLPGWSCPIRHLTGIPCPGCFLTRSVGLSLNGQLGDALELHVLGPTAATGLLLFAVLSIRRRRLLWTPSTARFAAAFAVAAVLVWSVRIVQHYGYGVKAFP